MPTVEGYENALIEATGQWIALAGFSLSPSTDTSPRSYLQNAIGYGLSQVGYPPSNPDAIVNGDIDAAWNNDEYYNALDWSEYRVLKNVLGNWAEPDEKAGLQQQDWGDLRSQLVKQFEAKAKELGIALSPLKSGVVIVPFTESSSMFVP